MDMQCAANTLDCPVTIDFIDGKISDEHNMLDDLFAEALINKIKSKAYDGVIMAPPCATYSAVRGQAHGPEPLRGVDDTTIFGLPELPPDEESRKRSYFTEPALIGYR